MSDLSSFPHASAHPPIRRDHLAGSTPQDLRQQIERALAAEANGVHATLGTPLYASAPEGYASIFLAMGCYWGAEKLLWSCPGVYVTEVGFMGGHTKKPTYREVCTGTTGHAETVHVVFDPDVADVETLLTVFFENHDPTQVNRQGNDVGSQYRSAIWTLGDDHLKAAHQIAQAYQHKLTKAGYGRIATEIAPAPTPFWYAHPGHQQYLAKNPNGYCPLHATGVRL